MVHANGGQEIRSNLHLILKTQILSPSLTSLTSIAWKSKGSRINPSVNGMKKNKNKNKSKTKQKNKKASKDLKPKKKNNHEKKDYQADIPHPKKKLKQQT